MFSSPKKFLTLDLRLESIGFVRCPETPKLRSGRVWVLVWKFWTRWALSATLWAKSKFLRIVCDFDGFCQIFPALLDFFWTKIRLFFPWFLLKKTRNLISSRLFREKFLIEAIFPSLFFPVAILQPMNSFYVTTIRCFLMTNLCRAMRNGASLSGLADESDETGVLCSEPQTGQITLSFCICLARQASQYEWWHCNSNGLVGLCLQ